MRAIISDRTGKGWPGGGRLVAGYLLLSYLLLLGLLLVSLLSRDSRWDVGTLREALFIPLLFTPFCLPFVATGGFLVRVAARGRIGDGGRSWARRLAQLVLLCWACALSLDVLAALGALADNLPPGLLCVDLRYDTAAPADVLDLRFLGLPCGYKPLTGTAVLLHSSAGLMRHVLPVALAFGLAAWSSASLIRRAVGRSFREKGPDVSGGEAGGGDRGA